MKSYLNPIQLLLRALYLFTTVYIFILFLASATHETGSAGVYVFAIPLFGAILIISYAIKIREEKYILLVIFVLLIIGFTGEQGSFIHTNLVGISMFSLFFHAIRPWR